MNTPPYDQYNNQGIYPSNPTEMMSLNAGDFERLGMRSRSKSVLLRRLVFNKYARLFQICLYAAIAVLAMIVSVTVLVTFEDLDHQCPLYAEPGLKHVQLTTDINGTRFLLVEKVIFGNSRTCHYSLYLNAVTSIYSVVWGILVTIVTNQKHSREGGVRRVVFPSLLMNSVIFTCELISSCVLTLGFAHWCETLVAALSHSREYNTHDHKKYSCPVLQSLPWKSSDKNLAYIRGSRMFALLTFAQMASWVLTFCTFLLSFICAERFFKSIWHGDLDQLAFQNLQGCSQSNIQSNGHTTLLSRQATLSSSPSITRKVGTISAGKPTNLQLSKKESSRKPKSNQSTPATEPVMSPAWNPIKEIERNISSNPDIDPLSSILVLSNQNTRSSPPVPDRTRRPPPLLHSKSLIYTTPQHISTSNDRRLEGSSSIAESLDRCNYTPDPLMLSCNSQRPLLTPKVWTDNNGECTASGLIDFQDGRKVIRIQSIMKKESNFNEVDTSEGMELVSTV